MPPRNPGFSMHPLTGIGLITNTSNFWGERLKKSHFYKPFLEDNIISSK